MSLMMLGLYLESSMVLLNFRKGWKWPFLVFHHKFDWFSQW